MPFLILHGKLQCVTTLVTFKDEAGKPYIVMGRPDPRYRDRTGRCLQGEALPVGPWQFIGGHAEYISSELRDDWREGYPQLTEWPAHLNRRIAKNALKELEEEAGISAEDFNSHEALRGLMAKATLTHMRTETSPSNTRGNEQDVHYLNLDLGTLSAAQIAALKKTVHPGDDLIQTIIAPIDKLYHDERGHMLLNPGDGYTNQKLDFDGFPEMEQWNERYNWGIRLGNEWSQKEKDIMNRIHQEVRGLTGVDENSLLGCAPIGMHVVVGKDHGSNGAILEQFLSEKYGFASRLQPRQPAPFCDRIIRPPSGHEQAATQAM